MISNRKIGQTQVLYLKQFFHHYFQKKTITETLSTLANGLAVLQILISNFQSSKGIKSPLMSPLKLQNQSKSQTINSIDQKNLQINQTFQDIYQRLQNIFENWNCSDGESLIACKQISQRQYGGDEQLYEMLNEYKKDNKKQKDLRKRAQSQACSLRKQLEQIEEGKAKISLLNKQYQHKIQKQQRDLKQKQKEIEDLLLQLQAQDAQREQLQKKMAHLTQAIQNLAEIQKANQQLVQNLKQSRQRELRIQKKFQSLQQIVKAKITQKQGYWHQLLQAKLNSQRIFQKGACNSFRKFMNTAQQLILQQKLNQC